MLTPDELQDLILEQSEKPNSFLTIERKSENNKPSNAVKKSPKESSSSFVCEDVHKVSMEVVETIRQGIIND